ncbi:PqiC family protein [Cerasicoccus maritimus]|uniref:PqiC family protein n=1 Tax=Cerasicoccus maritimus TaxID=490089 RepID=UPI0028528099|nr:PqiC family protein [Cerasicoccus maritimus]
MRDRILKIFLPILAVCLLALQTGCSLGKESTPSTFYVLTSLPQSTDALPIFEGDPPDVGVAQIEIPKYLDRPQMAYRVNTNQVEFNEFERWAEPISSGVTRVTRENLTQLLGPGKVAAFPWMQAYPRKYMLSAVVTDFSANNDGIAELSIIYRIADRRNQTTYLISEATFKDSSGSRLSTASAVEALSDTLEQFSRAAANDIAKVDAEQKAQASQEQPASITPK